jgi:hypothetical protein
VEAAQARLRQEPLLARRDLEAQLPALPHHHRAVPRGVREVFQGAAMRPGSAEGERKKEDCRLFVTEWEGPLGVRVIESYRVVPDRLIPDDDLPVRSRVLSRLR